MVRPNPSWRSSSMGKPNLHSQNKSSARDYTAPWSSTLSLKVNLRHAIKFRAVSKDEMAPSWGRFLGGGRNLRRPPSGGTSLQNSHFLSKVTVVTLERKRVD